MLVALAWFLTARLAADEAEAAARERNEELARIHQLEMAAVRMITSITAMSAAHRGFILSGTEDRLVSFGQARRSFSADSVLLHEYGARDARIRAGLARIARTVDRWEREVVGPSVERRRRGGLDAFAEGTPGARFVARGAAFLDTLRVQHAQLLRDLRDDVIRLEYQAEAFAARDEWEAFVLRAAAVAVFLLALALLMRLVARAMHQVVGAAEALDAGRYGDARLPHAKRAPNREMARLAHTFDRLAQSIEMRERQLQDDIEKLKELERLKADFVSTVSHELRTPLTSMRGALGLLIGGKAGEVPPKGLELLRIALTNTDRLIRLINDILDIEKMDAGHVAIRHDRLRLVPLIEATIAGLEGYARDADVRFVLTAESDVEVIGDSDRLIQVFTNLASNAIKFSPKGSAVEVTVHAASHRVVVSVRDHGPGIAPEFASRIFGRFQQAGGAQSRQSGGTGLGLSIAKGITELHGGQVGFENAEGGGASFWVALPIAAATASRADARAVVLVVEDDESLRAVLAASIEPFARPIAVVGAEAALALLATENVKVIIVDHGLPGMDGLAFSRRLRKDPRHRALALILYSAHEFTADELRESGVRVADAFVKTRDRHEMVVDRVRRELHGAA